MGGSLSRRKSQSGTHHMNWSDWTAHPVGSQQVTLKSNPKQTYHLPCVCVFFFSLVKIEAVLYVEYTHTRKWKTGTWIVCTENVFISIPGSATLLYSTEIIERELVGWWTYKMQNSGDQESHPYVVRFRAA